VTASPTLYLAKVFRANSKASVHVGKLKGPNLILSTASITIPTLAFSFPTSFVVVAVIRSPHVLLGERDDKGCPNVVSLAGTILLPSVLLLCDLFLYSHDSASLVHPALYPLDQFRVSPLILFFQDLSCLIAG
jgi:hypothetical protein